MFGAGFTELLLIFVIGLLILGPERLPRVAAQIGRWIGRARRTANQLRYQLEREIALEEVTRKQKKQPPRPSAEQPATDEPTGAAAAPGESTDSAHGEPEAGADPVSGEPGADAATSPAAGRPGPSVTAESDAPPAEPARSIHPSPAAERTATLPGDDAAAAELEPPAKQSTGR